MLLSAAQIKISGIVQGVGFRPFVHRLAGTYRLTGNVRNTSEGVEIYIEGSRSRIRAFYRDCSSRVPSLARIFSKTISFCNPRGCKEFTILQSTAFDRTSALVPADIGLCPDCYEELFDPQDRRYLYPFINCTNCGPRFSIMQRLPYDRRQTTMAPFALCPDCRKEYRDINNRRYHAQPNACSACGPQVSLIRVKNGKATTSATGQRAVCRAVSALKRGAIIAVKGIGGFHIAADPSKSATVKKLRRRKLRPSKPFAVMVSDIAEAGKLCFIDAAEKGLLESPERPIVLLRKIKDTALSSRLAPDNNYLGVMLCYTPLHYLLFSRECSKGTPLRVLIMTSANFADEPIETDDRRCIERLSGVCDYFLVNNRAIHNRIDDSIVQAMEGKPVVLRRARGYAPFPFIMPQRMKETLTCGAELKNTLALGKNRLAFVSQYLGDLKTAETYAFYQQTLKNMETLFDIRPRLVAADMHPDYLSTRLAQDYSCRAGAQPLRLTMVQHHHAHLASVIAEHRINGKVIGVCMDGVGYGTDKHIWGGEFFTGDARVFIRAGHLAYHAMPGGDKATQEPWRMAVSYLYQAFGEKIFTLNLPPLKRHVSLLRPLISGMQHVPVLTSSAGRLFDAVSSMLGICDTVSYEAQAAIRLQMLAERSPTQRAYGFDLLRQKDGMLIIETSPAIKAIVADIRRGVPREDSARAFHNGFAAACACACAEIRRQTHLNTACLSGGVFQNKLFLETLAKKLRAQRFKVYYNELLPANDGAIALGQMLIANS